VGPVFVEAAKSAEDKISTVEHKTGLDSDAVLTELAPNLVALGYEVESGKTKEAKIHRPVLFGKNGTPSVKYEIDAFHDELGIAVEVEAAAALRGTRTTGTSSAPLSSWTLATWPCSCRCATAPLQGQGARHPRLRAHPEPA
jgi:hypothetical protein